MLSEEAVAAMNSSEKSASMVVVEETVNFAGFFFGPSKAQVRYSHFRLTAGLNNGAYQQARSGLATHKRAYLRYPSLWQFAPPPHDMLYSDLQNCRRDG